MKRYHIKYIQMDEVKNFLGLKIVIFTQKGINWTATGQFKNR